MRAVLLVLTLTGISACSGPMPDSSPSGVGFNNYDRYLAEKQLRDAQLARQQTRTVRPAVQPSQTPEQQTASAAGDALRGTGGPEVSEVETRSSALPGETSAAGIDQNNPGISDEQDFGAVSGRESIESDANRRQAQSAQYQVVAPTAVPNRPSNVTPTPIEFALSTSHSVGDRQYGRGIANRAKAERNCQTYNSTDLAQDAFLKAGGPTRDRLGLDPDGDGFACGWNPAKSRGLRGG